MKSIEIYFDDLKAEVQEKILSLLEITYEEGNWEISPIAILEWETEEK
jgi:hypothetical protein